MSQVPYERTKWTAFRRRTDFNMNVLEHLPMPLELPSGGIISAGLGRRKRATRLDCLDEGSLNSQDWGSAQRDFYHRVNENKFHSAPLA